MVKARHSTTGAMGQSNLGALNLALTTLTAQLAHDLNNLRNTGGANWVTL